MVERRHASFPLLAARRDILGMASCNRGIGIIYCHSSVVTDGAPGFDNFEITWR
jgi:hypothetical protein